MSTKLSTIIADFTTVLASELSIGGTTATLTSATDDDGIELPSGRYFFTLDGSNSSKEHISCDLLGTALTNIKSVSRQGVETVGVKRKHRIGSSVSITDFAHILQINNLLNGTTDLNSLTPLKYDGVADMTGSTNKLASVKYVNDTATAGAPNATTSTKGITRLSTAPVSATEPIAVGDNDGRLIGNNLDIAVGTGNKFVTQTGLQHNAEKYVLCTSNSSTAYTGTYSPAPTSITDGMEFFLKIDVANTTTTPTFNPNGLGAKTIVKRTSTALAVNDLIIGQVARFVYDGTNMVLQNPSSTTTLFNNGTTTRAFNASSGTQTIAHGLGKIPSAVRINANVLCLAAGNAYSVANSIGVFSNSVTNCVYNSNTGTTSGATFFPAITGTALNIIYLYDKYDNVGTYQLQTATITVDATNITLTWTLVNNQGNSNNMNILWEAIIV